MYREVLLHENEDSDFVFEDNDYTRCLDWEEGYNDTDWEEGYNDTDWKEGHWGEEYIGENKPITYEVIYDIINEQDIIYKMDWEGNENLKGKVRKGFVSIGLSATHDIYALLEDSDYESFYKEIIKETRYYYRFPTYSFFGLGKKSILVYLKVFKSIEDIICHIQCINDQVLITEESIYNTEANSIIADYNIVINDRRRPGIDISYNTMGHKEINLFGSIKTIKNDYLENALYCLELKGIRYKGTKRGFSVESEKESLRYPSIPDLKGLGKKGQFVLDNYDSLEPVCNMPLVIEPFEDRLNLSQYKDFSPLWEPKYHEHLCKKDGLYLLCCQLNLIKDIRSIIMHFMSLIDLKRYIEATLS